MSAIPGVPVTGLVVPKDDADTYPVTDPKYQLGGWRTCATLADRNAIPTDRRMRGMQVYVAEDDSIYRLGAGLSNADWVASSAGVAPHTHPISDITGLQAALDAKAALASPTFTGAPAAPTAAPGANSTQIATTAYADQVKSSLVDSAPTGLNTIGKLSNALGADPNFATSVATALGLKAPLASPAFTGSPTVPNVTAGDNSTKAANTAFVTAAVAAGGGGGGAPLNSPAFTGTPTAPTAAAGTSTNQLATCLYVGTAVANLIGGAPGTYDTLGEIATKLGSLDADIAGKQSLHANLTAESGLTGAADQVAYYTGAGAKSLTSFTSTGRGVVGVGSSTALRRYVDRGATALVDGATISGADGASSTVYSVTIAGNRTLPIPTNIQPGATYVWFITNDATVGRTLTLGTGFYTMNGAAYVHDGGANKVTVLTAVAYSTTQLLVIPAGPFL